MPEKTCPFCGETVTFAAGESLTQCPECEMELRPARTAAPRPGKPKGTARREGAAGGGAKKKAGSSARKSAGKDRAAASPFADRKVLILGGGGALAGLMLMCGVGLWMVGIFSGDRKAGAGGDAAAGDNRDDGGGGLFGGLFGGSDDDNGRDVNVVIDAPVPALPAIPPENTWPDDPRLPDSQYPIPTGLPDPKWILEPDPSPETVALAENVPPLTGYRIHAALNGPFMADVPRELANLAGPGLPADQTANHQPVPVYDVRTGQAVGTFPPQAPTWRQGRLGPDGVYLVGPETTPEATATRQEGKVFVWKRDEAAPVAEIALDGLVIWAEFIGPDRFVTVSVERKLEFGTAGVDGNPMPFASETHPWVRVWDVTSGDRVKELELEPYWSIAHRRFETERPQVPGELRQYETPLSDELVAAFAAKVEPQPKVAYVPRRELGAVSHGGKYMVLSGSMYLSFITLPDLKIASQLMLGEKKSRMDHRGFNFSDDGQTLYAIIDYGGVDYPTEQGIPEGLYLLAWSMRDGRELLRSHVPTDRGEHFPGLHGPVYPAGALDSFVISRRKIISTRDVRDIPHEFERGDGELPGEVLEVRFRAAVLGHLPYVIERSAGPGKLLVRPSDPPFDPAQASPLVPEVPPPTSFTVAALDETTIRSLNANAWSGKPPRPAATAADRSQVQVIDPQPPGKWSVPKAGNVRPQSQTDRLVLWPDAFADNEAASVRIMWKPEGASSTPPTDPAALKRWLAARANGGTGATSPPEYTAEQLMSGILPEDDNTWNGNPRGAIDWRRYDLKTGGLIAAPVEIYPWAPPINVANSSVVSALTASADKLAVVDPADTGRVDIFDKTGQHVAGFRPHYGDAVEWLGWGGDTLLTLGNGTVVGWSIPACAAVYEVNGGYYAPPKLEPGRAWLAADAVAHTDFIDAATGAILGRCQPQTKTKAWTRFTALSPDGQRYLHLYPHKDQRNIDPDTAVANVWNLATGEEQEPFEFEVGVRLPSDPRVPVGFWPIPHGPATGPIRGVVWTDESRFLVLSHISWLLDADLREPIALYTFAGAGWADITKGYYGKPFTEYVSPEPSGKLWVHRVMDPAPSYWVTTFWNPLPVPGTSGADAPLSKPERKYAFTPDTPLKIDVDLDGDIRAKKAAVRIASGLQHAGFTIGPNGWTLKVTYTVVDAGWGFDSGGGPVPAVEIHWALLEPDGTSAWTGTSVEAWSYNTSRYRGETYMEDNINGYTEYNFYGQDFREAIVDEILDVVSAAQTEWVSPTPRIVLKTNDGYTALPMEASLAIPDAAPAGP